MVALVVAVLASSAAASIVAAWRVASTPADSSAGRRRIHIDDLPGWSPAGTADLAERPPMEMAAWLQEQQPGPSWRPFLRFLGLVALLALAAGAIAGTVLGVARLAGLELARFLHTS